uniref:Uncharacterized protein n=1 Tax=Arundo donax TaxID=35708 RepID=A0A0A9FGD8_ARUDO
MLLVDPTACFFICCPTSLHPIKSICNFSCLVCIIHHFGSEV